MKNILLIGLGRFGRHLAMELNRLGHQIMAVDRDEERVNECMPFVTNAQIGDSTRLEFLRSLGIGNYDICYVTICGSFQDSLETVSLLKELGAKTVVARADRDVQEKFLLRNGADYVTYPEKQLAKWSATRYTANHLFDYIELDDIEYFPQSDISAFLFLRWADEFLPLAFTGLCINIGLFAHLVIMWAGPLGKQVKGLFYGAPSHDVPALIAFLTILITTVNFVVSVEVNFYPKYRNYYSLFNDGGTIKDIMQAGTEMLDVLNRELKYTALKQLLTTALAISMGESLLKYLPLGFNDLMYGYFRTLCVGYGIYAVANTMLLLLLYFTDYRGALAASVIFAVGTSVFTVTSLFCPQVYYGFGFLAGCVLFYFIVMIRLERYTRRLPYYILSIQPVVAEDKSGVFTRIGCFMDEKLERRTSVDRN